MTRNRALILLVIILLAAFFLRQTKLLDFPYYGDEVDYGDIAVEILHGNIVPFFPHSGGQEALYSYTVAASFAVLGESLIASRWPSVAWSMIFVALMYVYGRMLFNSRRVGAMAAGLTAVLWWPAVFAHVGLRVVSMPVMSTPALIGLLLALRTRSERRAMKAGVIGGIFAGLTAYTYTAGRGFPGVVILFLAYAALAHRERLLKRWRVFLVYLILTAAVSAWLYIYLRLHPGYDVRIGIAQEGLGMLARGDYGGFLGAVRDTLAMFTVRGDLLWIENIAGRPVFTGPEGWLFYLGVLMCLWRLRKPEYALQLIVIAIMLVPSLLTEHPPSWGRSIGVLPALLVTTVLPVEWAWSKLERVTHMPVSASVRVWLGRAALPLYTALVVALGVSVYVRTAYDMLQVWMNHPGVYWMTYAFYNETADFINRSPDSTPLDFNMDVAVQWRMTNLKRPVNRRDVELRWTVNNAFVFPDNPQGLRMAFQMLAPPALALQQAFFDPKAPIYIGPRADPTGQHLLRIYDIPRAKLDERLARARQGEMFLPRTSTPVTPPVKAGDLLEFLGYEVLNPDVLPGDKLMVLTYWRMLQRPPDISIFLHLIDETGTPVSQYDGFDVVTDYVMPGDMVVQLHTLELPSDVSNATYRLQVGVYLNDTLERLPLSVEAPDRVLWLQTWRPKR